jgi:predicted Zn finger-like uncharacterized protein
MLIDCPDCAAQYDVPDGRLRAGLRLRCSHCAAEFAVPAAPVAQAEPLAAAAPVLAADAVAESAPLPGFLSTGPRLAPERAPVRHGRPYGLVAAWLLSFVILGGGGWAAVHWRAPIMRTWPPATRAFAAIGLGEQSADPGTHF